MKKLAMALPSLPYAAERERVYTRDYVYYDDPDKNVEPEQPASNTPQEGLDLSP